MHFLAVVQMKRKVSLLTCSQFVLLIKSVGETHVAADSTAREGKGNIQSQSSPFVGVLMKQLLGERRRRKRENEVTLRRVFCFLCCIHLSQAFSKRLTRTVDCGYREEPKHFYALSWLEVNF